MKKKIKAELWKVEVCESVLDMVHGNKFHIFEIFIPSKKISFNVEHEGLNVFTGAKSRYVKAKENFVSNILLDNSFVECLQKHLDIKTKAYKMAKDKMAKEIFGKTIISNTF